MITSPFMETINYFLKFFNEKQDLKFYEMTKISTVPKHEYFDILAMVMNLITSSFMKQLITSYGFSMKRKTLNFMK